jgi:hypothetical protein
MRRIHAALSAAIVVAAVAGLGALSGEQEQKPAAKETSASGTVLKVSDTSLTIKASSGEQTFVIDEKTRVEGPRFGTRTRELKAKGEKPTLTKFIQADDDVRVRYAETGGKMIAEEVRLVRRPPGR